MLDSTGGTPHLPWSDSFNVGIDALDADHRALVQRINAVCAAWHGGRIAEALDELGALCVLASEHFQREEAVLRSLAGYPRQDAHAGEHRTRMRQLTALHQRFQESSVSPGTEPLCDELIDWFVRQSIGHDAAIKAYIDDRGLRFAPIAPPGRTS